MPLTAQVARVLAGIPRIEGNPWVIAGGRRGEPLKDINSYWYRRRERAGLDDLRLHDCRHIFAFQALAIGERLPTIARLLGHKTVMTTYRYAHLAEDSEKASVAREHPSLVAPIERSVVLANALGVRRTPAFVIGVDMIRGALPPEQFRVAIAEARIAPEGARNRSGAD